MKFTNKSKKKEIAKIAIVIPAFNEEKRLPPFLESVLDYAKKNPVLNSVIIVDDGSSDRTVEIVENFAKKNPILNIIKNEKNCGKGFAVRRGILNSEADAVLYADADGATPIEELDKLLDALRSTGADIAVGSRLSAQAKRSGFRALVGKIFRMIVKILAVPNIDDTQCGFKLFRRDVAKMLFSRSVEDGWAFDVEILYMAQLFAYSMVQRPLNWSEKAGSKVNIAKDSLKMLIAVFRIRKRHYDLSKDSL
jgi:dolichyl-phosphate beta-glucosyltransferase